MIIPCIDIINRKAVQLVQGKEQDKKIETDIEPLIERFKDHTINVIDLDAAFAKGDNLSTIKDICSKIKCRVGGGVNSIEKAQQLIGAGAKKVIIGSKAFIKVNDTYKINDGFLKQLNEKIGKEKIIIAIDSKNQDIVIKGWKESTKLNIFKTVKQLESYCSEFLATYVDKEGMMQGTNIDFFEKLRKLTNNKITAAGGISSNKEIEELEKINVDSAVGMALYKGKIKL